MFGDIKWIVYNYIHITESFVYITKSVTDICNWFADAKKLVDISKCLFIAISVLALQLVVTQSSGGTSGVGGGSEASLGNCHPPPPHMKLDG